MITIKCQGLGRTYETYKKPDGILASLKGFWDRQYIQKMALAPTDLEIKEGQIIGLVGANGAGKTTLLKLLSGLIYPSSGSAQVLGFTPWDRNNDYLRQISILLGQKNQLWWDIPPMDSYFLLGKIYGISEPTVRERVKELANHLACEEQLEIQLRRLSLGERMKMEIIGSLLHRPRVLFLDEPTIGLDVVAQSRIRSFLEGYVRTYQPTIVLTSHYMDDISQLADRLLLISQGKIVYDGTVETFTERSTLKQILHVVFQTPTESSFSVSAQTIVSQGVREWRGEVANSEMGTVLANLIKHTQIQDLKTEEVNFEEVIHQFLAAESRPL